MRRGSLQARSPTDPARLREALKALFASRRAEAERFDEIFDAFWRGLGPSARRGSRPRAAPTAPIDVSAPGRRAGNLRRRSPACAWAGRRRSGGGAMSAALQATDSLSKKDFANLTGESERAEAHALAEQLARAMRARLTRRERARAKGRGSTCARRSVARSRAAASRSTSSSGSARPSPCASSRCSTPRDRWSSMFPYSRASCMRSRRRSASRKPISSIRAWRMSRRRCASGIPQRALDRLSLMAAGVGGGTKIGDCLAEFNRLHANRALNSRTCVMIFSDGYDTGDPERLAAAMRDLAPALPPHRLARSSHRARRFRADRARADRRHALH